MVVAFHKAVKSASYLRMGLSGPSGSGKTYTALILASSLAGDKGVAVIDTERGSASKYSDLYQFDVLELDNFHPDHYIEAIHAAEEAGYGALVIDSLSHAWNATGGLLEQHENAVKRQQTKNSYTAWAEITPIQNRLINAITGAKLHVIATMRSKTEYVLDDKKVRKVGLAPIQRDGMEYEFDVFGEMDVDNSLIVQKSRCPELSGAVVTKPGKGVADTLSTWLHGSDGSTTPVVRTPEPETPARATVTPAKQPQKSIEQMEKELKDRALSLGLSSEDYNTARKHHKTYAATAAALNAFEEKQKQSAQEATAVESAPVEAAPEPGDDAFAGWDTLEARSYKAGMHKTKADWEQIMEETGGSYEDTLAKLVAFEQHDLHAVPALSGGGSRH